jgi:transcriptional regulator with XRE-family HTH domain
VVQRANGEPGALRELADPKAGAGGGMHHRPAYDLTSRQVQGRESMSTETLSNWTRAANIARMTNTVGVAALLRELRESRGETLRIAADGLGIDPSHLSRVERGEKQPSFGLTQKAASYYRVSEDLVQLSIGQVPEDVLEILRAHPEELDRLRSTYGVATT